MKLDKFGVAALLVGLVIFAGVLHFAFMEPAGGWGVEGLITAITATVLGGLILFGIVLIIIGLLLILL